MKRGWGRRGAIFGARCSVFPMCSPCVYEEEVGQVVGAMFGARCGLCVFLCVCLWSAEISSPSAGKRQPDCCLYDPNLLPRLELMGS